MFVCVLLCRLPYPLKSVYWAFLVVFTANIAAFFLAGDTPQR